MMAFYDDEAIDDDEQKRGAKPIAPAAIGSSGILYNASRAPLDPV